MSTGITCPIEERALGLREYLERCWALCSREHSVESPLPLEITEDKHYQERVTECEMANESAKSMSVADAALELVGIAERNETFWREYHERKAALRLRYDTLIGALEMWNPPTEVTGYRTMAICHAVESRDFDCPSVPMRPATRPTAEEWLADKRAAAERCLTRARADLALHRANIRQANAVLEAIRAVQQ